MEWPCGSVDVVPEMGMNSLICIFMLFLPFVFWLGNRTRTLLYKFIGPNEGMLLDYVLRYRKVILIKRAKERIGEKNERGCLSDAGPLSLHSRVVRSGHWLVKPLCRSKC